MAFCCMRIAGKIIMHIKLYRKYPNGKKRYFRISITDINGKFVSMEYISGRSDYEISVKMKNVIMQSCRENKPKGSSLHFIMAEISEVDYVIAIRKQEN